MPLKYLLQISFKDKTTGVHAGRICTVNDYDGTKTFYIKTNFGGPKRSSTKSGMVPNMREIFGYCLLEQIGVGPESHFLCPPPGTALGTIFIATKAITDFDGHQLDNLFKKNANIMNTLIEIHILCTIFCMTDVHHDNCGQVKEKTIIIDFAIPAQDGNFEMKYIFPVK